MTFGSATSDGTLDLAGHSQTVGGLSVAAAVATPANEIITNSTGSATLTSAGNGSTTFGGTIQDTAPTGVLALHVAGGQLVLSGNNTYAGGTTVNGGTLQLAVTNALPATGNITAATGGVLDLGGNAQTTSGVVSLQGGTVQNGTLTSSVSDFDGQSGTVTATLDGPVALSKTTSGLLVVGGANNPVMTYTNGTNISGGTLQLGSASPLPGSGNITVYAGGTLDLGGTGAGQVTSGTVSIQGGVIQNGTLYSNSYAFDAQSGTVTANLAGGVGLNKTTAGTLLLGGTGTYTGDTVVSAGTLQLGSANGVPGGPGTGNVDLDGGAAAGVVDINGNSPDFGGLSGAAGAVLGVITNNGASAGTLTVGDNGGTTTFSGTITDGASTLGFAKAGGGTLTLAGSNAYSGGTTVAQGVLVLTNTAALGSVTSSTNLTVNNRGELQLPATVVNVGNVFVAGAGVSGLGAINGGTLNVLGANIVNNTPNNTALIGSPTILNATATTLSLSNNGNQELLFNFPVACSGSLVTSGSGYFVFHAGSAGTVGTVQEGTGPASSKGVIEVQPGATFNCGTYYVPSYNVSGNYAVLRIDAGATMNTAVFYNDNSPGTSLDLDGSGGTVNVATFIGSGGGAVVLGNGVFNVTGSAAIGGYGPFGTQHLGATLQQNSGVVNMSGTGDGFTIGFSSAGNGNGAYTQFGGMLNVPNEYVELGYESGAGGNSFFQVLGNATTPATANVYGISLGQTVNNGVQNGNATVKLGDGLSLLRIGAGGIIAAGTGTQVFDLASGTLASSAPWSTTVPLTLNGAGNAPTNIDATAGTISLNGPVGGAGGILEIGSGILVLDGTGTYTGGTTVDSGELIVADNEAIEGGSSLEVGSDLAAFGMAIPAEVGHASVPVASPVPEPGTLTLLAVAACIARLYRRRRR